MASLPPLSAELSDSFVIQENVEAAAQLFDQGSYVLALKAFTRVLELDPREETSCVGKVCTLRQLNRPRGSLKACEAALEHFPQNTFLLSMRNELWEELGDEEANMVSVPKTFSSEELDTQCEDDCWSSDMEDEESFVDCESCASEDEDGGSAPCPSSKAQALADREARTMRAKSELRAALEAEPLRWDCSESAPFREAKKVALLKFYRDFYMRTRAKSVDTSQYTVSEKSGLSLKGAHRHMPRPKHVDLPATHGTMVGTLSPAELAEFNSASTSGRFLVSVHGDIFDVSDRPDKYGADGPYSSMSGHDITWALWSGLDDDDQLDKYFDLQRASIVEERDRRLQGLMSWWAFFEQEYGSPVGRLSVYENEWELPAPPAVEDLCTIM
jgi:tetratricopeptide (TPR) repeat protein